MLDPDAITSRQFIVSLRGYDREQVRAFQQEVAGTVAALLEQVDQLGRRVQRLERDAQEAGSAAGDGGPARPEAVFAQIGAETQRILQAAQEAAEQMLRKARSDADAQDRQARAEAARLVAEGQRRREEAEALVARLDSEREAIVERLRGVSAGVQRLLTELAPAPSATVREALAAAVAEPAEPVAAPEREPETLEAAPEPEPVATPEPEPAALEPEPAVAEREPEPAVAAPEPGPPDPLALRSEALAPLHPKLARKLKRDLQEVQNIVLDRVRRARGRGQPDDFLPADGEVAVLASAQEHLDRAWRAGVDAAPALAGRPAEPVGDAPDLGDAFAAEAAERLRSGLAGTLRIGLDAGEASQALADRIGAVFGDFKAAEADDLAAGHLVRAYEVGLRDAWAASGVAARRWVLGREQRCPEARCRRNDQSEPLPLDRPFPSGHEVPPVHAGCTCTTAPVTA